jgi:hypothetical protein
MDLNAFVGSPSPEHKRQTGDSRRRCANASRDFLFVKRSTQRVQGLAILPSINYNDAMANETQPSPPPAIPQTVPATPAVAIWSLILAVLSFTCGWLFTAIPAVICGHIARAKIRKSGGALRGRGIATAGLILGYIALVLGVMGIPLLISMIKSDRERLQRLSTERKEIVSDVGKMSVIIPGTWTKLPELNKQASLQVGNKSKEVYLIVITDAKTDLDGFTLEKHHQQTRDRMLQTMKNVSATEPVSLRIDDHPALQDELTGTENGTNVVFLHTTVDDGDHFQQILAWTLKSRWQKQNQLLREVTRSFRSEKARAILKAVGFSGSRSAVLLPAPVTATFVKNLKAARTLGSR